MTAAELARFDLVLVSSSVVPTTVGDRLASSRFRSLTGTVPLRRSGFQAAGGQGESIAVTGASLVTPGHPMVGGFGQDPGRSADRLAARSNAGR
ncbi:MAG: hypothetical protein R2705_08550 [Ilumatobacteraceae bacterium]